MANFDLDPQTPKHWVITCAPGLEDLLIKELVERLGISKRFETSQGAVSFSGTLEEAFSVLLRSQLASRVLWNLRTFSAKTAEMLYDQVRRLPWAQIFYGNPPVKPASTDLIPTFAIFVHGAPKQFAMQFAALKIKDAICDEVRKAAMDRPSVDRKNPDVRLEALFDSEGRCSLSLDLTGNPLHRRGYRLETLAAPLRENRAAALAHLSGVLEVSKDSNEPLFVFDPFCGGGTLLFEAAIALKNLSPGISRKTGSWPFYRLFPEWRPLFDESVATARAFRYQNKRPVHLVGFDIDKGSLRSAKLQAERLGLKITEYSLEVRDSRELPKIPAGSFVLTHPPFGIRSGDEAKAVELIEGLTHNLKKQNFDGTLGIVIPKGPLEKSVGLRPKKKLLVSDGNQDLRLLVFEMYPGRKSAAKDS